MDMTCHLDPMDGRAAGSSTCNDLESDCDGLVPRTCVNGAWKAGLPCTAGCRSGACTLPPSCDKAPLCGLDQASCCQTLWVPGGTFTLRGTSTSPTVRTSASRTVSPVALDRFEVTVERFRAFVASYSKETLPADGAGAHPHVPGSGWNSVWNDDPELLPPSRDQLQYELTKRGSYNNDTPSDEPIRNVNWYVAFAFCVWDEGRLPTEAEWAFAASGGDEQRIYPWSSSDRDTSIDESRACYWTMDWPRTSPEVVGSHPMGRGKYGHDDLAGNVREWLLDYYRDELSECTAGSDDSGGNPDCVELTPSTQRALRGGSFQSESDGLLNTVRISCESRRLSDLNGFRCARD